MVGEKEAGVWGGGRVAKVVMDEDNNENFVVLVWLMMVETWERLGGSSKIGGWAGGKEEVKDPLVGGWLWQILWQA